MKRQTIVRAATLIAAGNIVSRVLGLGREVVIAYFFGATEFVSAFRIAQQVPTMLYDLLVGGMVSSAFVPIFSEQAERDRTELWHIASLILTLVTLIMSLTVLLIELAAPQVAYLMASGFSDSLLVVTTRLLRITTPAILLLGLSGVVTGLLQALNRFALPAFTAAVFNATIIVTAMLGVTLFDWGIEALAVGLLLGAFMQLLLQLPGLRDAQLRFVFNLRHPTLRRVVKLVLPILLGLAISQLAIAIDRNLASRTGEQSIAWMQNATTIIQFPLGLIAAAISLAILPTLSRLAITDSTATGQSEPIQTAPSQGFMEMLAQGLRFVLILIIPATVALFILADPIVSLLFERGRFMPYDSQQTTLALRFYLLGLTFAAIDQPLIFAYYARQNTLTPALVGLLGVGFYLVTAFSPMLMLGRPMQMTDLVLANSAQLSGHALVMLWLVNRLAPLHGHAIGLTTLKSLGAAMLMGALLWVTLPILQSWLGTDTFSQRAMLVVGLTIAGSVTYFAGLALLRVPELALIWGIVQRVLPLGRS
ncbi:murein biosynthesis integral membrane protein MurJ [Anaerolineales bacterium HSG25]|nr:murein biosynthesis integral membrane protein MurJ [Anaerolineales bacterium HSG25]